MRAGIVASARVASSGVTATWQASAVDVTDASSYTFSTIPIGAASSSRRVVVAIGSASATAVTLSAVTIGGVSATVDADSGALTGNRRVVLVSAVVPTGITATVAITLSGTAGRIGVGLWTLTSGSPTGQTATSPNLTSGTLTVTTAAGHVVICAGYASLSSGSVSTTWTDATERYDEQIENTFNSHTAADVVATGSSTVVSYNTTSGTGQRGFVAAAYA